MDVEEVAAITDPETRAKEAGRLLRETQANVERLADIRKQAIRDMRDAGLTIRAIAERLELSKGTVQKLLS